MQNIRVKVHLKPSAKRSCLISFTHDTDIVIKASVVEPPENGKANTALIKLLSNTLKINKQDILIKSGLISRNKIIQITNLTEECLINKLLQFVPKLTFF